MDEKQDLNLKKINPVFIIMLVFLLLLNTGPDSQPSQFFLWIHKSFQLSVCNHNIR